MADATFYAIQVLHNPGSIVEIWDTVEDYPFYSTAMNRARVMLTANPKYRGRLRLVRCTPLNQEAIAPFHR